MIDPDMGEEAWAQRIAGELDRCKQLFVLEFEPLDAYFLAGVFQLALTHPQLPQMTRSFSVRMVETLRTIFEAAGCPSVVAAIDKRDDQQLLNADIMESATGVACQACDGKGYTQPVPDGT